MTPPSPAAPARPVPLLAGGHRVDLDPALLAVVEYRKSGLSLNWIVGCPLDCGYCVRHLFANYGMKTPRALMSDRDAFEMLTGSRFFRPHLTPVQLLNRATDPMLPPVKPHTFAMLRMLDDAGFRNHVLLITRWRFDDTDCTALNALRHLRVTILVTHSGIDDDRIEPVESGIAATSLRTAHAQARRYRVVLYWRPIVPGLNDTDAHLARAMQLSAHAHATVFTGLFYRDQIRDY
jgi:DNA repair photolyase